MELFSFGWIFPKCLPAFERETNYIGSPPKVDPIRQTFSFECIRFGGSNDK